MLHLYTYFSESYTKAYASFQIKISTYVMLLSFLFHLRDITHLSVQECVFLVRFFGIAHLGGRNNTTPLISKLQHRKSDKRNWTNPLGCWSVFYPIFSFKKRNLSSHPILLPIWLPRRYREKKFCLQFHDADLRSFFFNAFVLDFL